MRQRSEKSIEQACVRIAKAAGWESRKMNGLGFRDWPDRYFIPPIITEPKKKIYGSGQPRGEHFWVEFKRKGKKPTVSQWNRIKDLRSRGESVDIIDSVDLFKEVFNAYRY